MTLIRTIPIEPLFMRAKGEFEPGVSIFAESLILPRPSTIYGFIRNFFKDDKDIDRIYGIWIEKNREKYFPFRFGGSLAFVKESELPKVNKYLTLMKEDDVPYEEWESYFYSLLNGIEEIAKFQSRVGIALDRDKRTVKEGYLYTADYVAYKKGVELVVYVEGNINAERISTVKLGGEGRVVNVEFDKDHKEEFVEVSSDEMYLALSPIIVPNDIVNDIEKYIVTGEVNKIMLGMKEGKRNETVTAVLEGSVVYGKLLKDIGHRSAQYEEYIKHGYNTAVNLCGGLVQKN